MLPKARIAKSITKVYKATSVRLLIDASKDIFLFRITDIYLIICKIYRIFQILESPPGPLAVLSNTCRTTFES